MAVTEMIARIKCQERHLLSSLLYFENVYATFDAVTNFADSISFTLLFVHIVTL
jgi:hypothetical protein